MNNKTWNFYKWVNYLAITLNLAIISFDYFYMGRASFISATCGWLLSILWFAVYCRLHKRYVASRQELSDYLQSRIDQVQENIKITESAITQVENLGKQLDEIKKGRNGNHRKN